MEKKDFHKLLIHRYVTNQATEEELEAFFALLDSSEMDEELQAYLQEEAAKADDDHIITIRCRKWDILWYAYNCFSCDMHRNMKASQVLKVFALFKVHLRLYNALKVKRSLLNV